MCATFSDDDVDKPVENATGETVGVVAAVEGDTARVKPDPSAVESIKSSLGWEKGAQHRVALDRESVREVTPDAVRLAGDLPMGDESAADEMDAIEERARGAEVDPTELADRDTGLSVREGEDAQRTDMAVEPDEDAQRTDAAVDPDALRETDPADRGPTTEDGARGLEDDPETERLADPDSDSDDEGEDE